MGSGRLTYIGEQVVMNDKLYRDCDWLREQYWVQGLLQREIAEVAGCAKTTISKWMRSCGIGVEQYRSRTFRDPSWLRQQYWDNELTISQVATAAGCADSTIIRWMQEYDIERRDNAGIAGSPQYRNRDWLVEQYIVKNRSLKDIAQEAGCCRETISNWIDKYDIEKRIPQHTRARDCLYNNRDWLYAKYWEEELSANEIADSVNVSVPTIRYWMDKLDIPTRSLSEAAKLLWDEEYREKQARISKEIMQDPALRKRLSEALTEAHARGDFGEEWRQKQSQNTTALWQDSDYCRKQGEALRQALSNDEYRLKRKKIALRLWKDEKYRRNQAASWTQERRRVRSRISSRQMKQRHANGEFGEEWRQMMSEAQKESWARGDHDDAFAGPSQPEIQLSVALDLMGIDYEYQYRPEDYSRIYDFHIPEANLLIEYDGWFWHHSEWAIERGAEERDRDKDLYAEQNGYELLRIQERDMEQRGAWAIVVQDVLPLLPE